MFREEYKPEPEEAASVPKPAPPSVVLRQESVERLKGAIAPHAGTGRTALRAAPANRRNLLITSLPLALIVLVCMAAFVSRAAGPRLGRQTFGNTSRVEAVTIARNVLHELTGAAPRAVEVTTQTAFSYRRGATVHEWNVLCETPQGRYLMRLNADTGTVYAVNRLYGDSNPGEGAGAGALLSRPEAETRARAYLGLLGVPTAELTLVPERNLMPDPGHPARTRLAGTSGRRMNGYGEDATDLYNFTYRRPVPGLGSRLLKVSVSQRDAVLEHVWNPASAL